MSRPSPLKYHAQGDGSCAASIEPRRTRTSSGANVPPFTGCSGLISTLKATRHAEIVCASPQLIGPRVASPDSLTSIVIRSPATSTRTRTHAGSSPTPSLSRHPSAL
jgi:hypothetical protein